MAINFNTISTEITTLQAAIPTLTPTPSAGKSAAGNATAAQVAVADMSSQLQTMQSIVGSALQTGNLDQPSLERLLNAAESVASDLSTVGNTPALTGVLNDLFSQVAPEVASILPLPHQAPPGAGFSQANGTIPPLATPPTPVQTTMLKEMNNPTNVRFLPVGGNAHAIPPVQPTNYVGYDLNTGAAFVFDSAGVPLPINPPQSNPPLPGQLAPGQLAAGTSYVLSDGTRLDYSRPTATAPSSLNCISGSQFAEFNQATQTAFVTGLTASELVNEKHAFENAPVVASTTGPQGGPPLWAIRPSATPAVPNPAWFQVNSPAPTPIPLGFAPTPAAGLSANLYSWATLGSLYGLPPAPAKP